MYWNSLKSQLKRLSASWLTLTWDVLKFYSESKPGNRTRLTLTWDVLK